MKRKIIGIVLLIGFIIITLLLLTNNVSTYDEFIYKYIYLLRSNICDIIFKTFTYLGNLIPVTIITMSLLVFLRKKDRSILATSMIITLITNQIIKHIIRRPRPPLEERLITQGGYSYPSGHSMLAMCLYGVLIYFTFTKVKNNKIKFLLIGLFTTIILLIGISRIYVRVHYPSDVLAGFLLTMIILIITITIISNHFRGNKNDKDVDK